MSSIKVHYFDGFGKGEALRILLSLAKVDFEDVRYAGEAWS